jgi:hypothetical protein
MRQGPFKAKNGKNADPGVSGTKPGNNVDKKPAGF